MALTPVAAAPEPSTAGERWLRLEPVTRDEWIGLAASFSDHNHRQSWDVGAHAAARVGAVCEAVALHDDERTVALAHVRVRRLPVLGGIAYVSGGPLTRTGAARDAELFAEVAVALRDEYAVRRDLVLRIAPPLGPEPWNRGVAAALARAGFAPARSAHGYRTMVVPLDPSLSEIRGRLHQKWRNCLNRAEREGLTVRTEDGAGALAEFAALFERFVGRKGFTVALDAGFYAAVQRELPRGERLTVLLAERGGAVVAGVVASALGDTCVYLLGATSPEALACKAAYLLQWRAIETARGRGCRSYDLGGADPVANPGVFHFKEGLGGAQVTAAHPVEAHGGGAGARLTIALETCWRAVRTGRSARG